MAPVLSVDGQLRACIVLFTDAISLQAQLSRIPHTNENAESKTTQNNVAVTAKL